jgi:hypothetical protein
MSAGRRSLRTIGRFIVRLYALAIMLVVIWTAWQAVGYLVRYVFTPARVPERILEWQVVLDADALRAPGMAQMTGESARAPVGHYHSVEGWHDPMSGSSCTTSGCHASLPHTKDKVTRAFANLHAGFLNCQMCHEKGLVAPVDTVWVDVASGQPLGEPPAQLQLLKLLGSGEIPADVQPFNDRVLQLLSETLRHAGDDPRLKYLYIQIDTSLPESPVWRHAISILREEMPRHRGAEYGARLAPRVAGRDWNDYHGEIARLAEQYFKPDAQRDSLKKKIHEQVKPQPDSCQACHGGEPPLVEFVKAGYRAERAEELRGSLIARLIQHLRAGQQFHIPRLMPSDESSDAGTGPAP